MQLLYQPLVASSKGTAWQRAVVEFRKTRTEVDQRLTYDSTETLEEQQNLMPFITDRLAYMLIPRFAFAAVPQCSCI